MRGCPVPHRRTRSRHPCALIGCSRQPDCPAMGYRATACGELVRLRSNALQYDLFYSTGMSDRAQQYGFSRTRYGTCVLLAMGQAFAGQPGEQHGFDPVGIDAEIAG